MQKQIETQVLIVGAGSTGLAIARELSRYKVDVTVVEKNVDVCFGEVKASHGLIYSSIGLAGANSLVLKSIMTPDLSPSKLFHRSALKTKLTSEGFDVFPSVAEELDIGFKMERRVVVGKDSEDFTALQIVEAICKSMEINIEHLDQEAIQELEPHISRDFTRGLTRARDTAYVYPWEYGIALAENAKDNGVKIMLLTEVLGIESLDGGFIVYTESGPIRTRFIINAAGPFADRIAKMAGVCDFGLTFTRSQMLITDKRLSGLVNHVTCRVSRPGITNLIRPTLSGNIEILCSKYYPASGHGDTSTKMEWTDENITKAQELFPDMSKGDVINSFTGVRVFNTREPEEHLMEVSKGNPNFLNAVTRLPGLSFTPAMAKYIVLLLSNQGLELIEKTDFNPRSRKRIPKVSELPDEERKKLIAQDPRYGHIVCRCEEVSEGEILDAIRRGARTVAGVKYRTRAGMGRCQRGFCGPRVLEILARELDIPMTEVTQKGGLSRVLSYRSKELLGSGEGF
jgi:glycerol-3-phosphate dehydrogenase